MAQMEETAIAPAKELEEGQEMSMRQETGEVDKTEERTNPGLEST